MKNEPRMNTNGHELNFKDAMDAVVGCALEVMSGRSKLDGRRVVS